MPVLRTRASRAARALTLVSAGLGLSAAPAAAQQSPKPSSVTTRDGRFDWGAGVSLFRIGALRDPTLPGRTRRYETEIRPLDTQLTFQVFYHPASRPWRYTDEGTHRQFQMMSLSAFLLLGINAQQTAQSEIAVGVGMGFLENYLVLGVGFDLYRGVPVRGGDGVPGSHTVSTGLLGPVTSSEGQLTLENIFFVIHLNLVPLARSTR